MVKKHFLRIIVILMTFGGCQKASEGGSDPFFVRFNLGNFEGVEVDSPKSSESTFSTKTPKPLAVGTTVRVVAYKSNGGTPSIDTDRYITAANYVVEGDAGVLVPCTVNTEGDFVNSTNAPSISLFNGNYDFYAYSPARPLGGDNKTVSSIPHGVDFLGILPVTQSISKSTSGVTLSAFDHKCSRVVFKISPSTGVEFDELFATKIMMDGLAATPTSYALGEKIAPSIGGSSYAVTEFTAINDSDKGKGSIGKGVVLPKTVSDISLLFELVINGAVNNLVMSDKISVTFGEGLSYEFTVNVASRSVEMYLRIVPWDSYDWDDSNMGGGNGGILVGTWTDIDWADSNMGGGNGDILLGTWKGVDWSDDNMGSE